MEQIRSDGCDRGSLSGEYPENSCYNSCAIQEHEDEWLSAGSVLVCGHGVRTVRMGLRNLLYATLICGASGLPLSSMAQKFHDPTPDELKMTSDAKAPGAPAVYLDREETTDNTNHYVSEYARIKVLTEKGKEYATVEVPYVPGFSATPIIEARTIHADGTVIPLTGKPEDLLVVKTDKNRVNAAVFNMPSVEVGSILEYKWTMSLLGGSSVSGVSYGENGYYASLLASSVPVWNVQKDIFIHKEHFYFNPKTDLEKNVIGSPVTHYNDEGEVASYLLYAGRLPLGGKVQVTPEPNSVYTLDLTDVPAIPREENAPPEQSRIYQVRFYYTPYVAGEIFWSDEGKRWAKEIDRMAEPSGALRSAAAQIVGSASSDDEKARKLYDAVQALENTAFSREKSEEERRRLGLKREVRSVEQVWNEKSGTRNEIATLYLALARAAGLQASAISVADREERIFDPSYLSLSQLTATLVVLHINGTDVYVDPGEKLLPYGQLTWNHTLCGGLQETSNGVVHNAITPANAIKEAITAHAANLTVGSNGAATGTLQVVMNGPRALYWRQLNLTDGGPEVEKRFDEQLRTILPAGLQGEVEKMQGIDTSAGFLTVTASVSGQLGNAMGKRIVLPAFPFSQGEQPGFIAEEKREEPVDLHFAEQVIDDVVFHLPAGYAVESAPQPVQLPWMERAQMVVKTQPGAGTLDVRHTFARGFVMVDAKDYGALRDYYQKIATNDQQQVVLAAQ